MSLNLHAIIAMVLTAGSLFLLSRKSVRMEHASIAILVVMVTVFELFPVEGVDAMRGADFLAGFGNEALVTICLLLILAKGIEASGALRPAGRLLTRLWIYNRSLALLATLLVAAFVSAFANNTPVVVMLLPVLVGVAHRIGLAPSKMLMPVGFATIVGGMSTSIGTSTNLLVVSIAADMGLPRLSMFDFALPALLAGLLGIIYLWLALPRILPARPTLLEDAEPRIFDSVLTVSPDSPLDGKPLSEAMSILGDDIRIAKIERGSGLEIVRLPTLTLLAGDRLKLRGSPESIGTALEHAGGKTETEIEAANDEQLVEIVVTPDSPLHNKRLSQLRPGTLRGLQPVGWHRPGKGMAAAVAPFTDPNLHTGDVLLMQGSQEDVEGLMREARMLILARSVTIPRVSKAPLAIAIMAGVVAIAAFGILPIVASALAGAGLMLATRCLTWREAIGAIDTRLALVIAASLALGTALSGTGAAAWIAHGFVGLASDLPPPVVLSALLLLTALLTEVVTNNAIAVIATPIAISVATELGLPPLPFVLAILFGANMSYLTPIGYQTNLLVMSAGGYRFSDFFRGGLPLQLTLWAALSVLLTVIYL